MFLALELFSLAHINRNQKQIRISLCRDIKSNLLFSFCFKEDLGGLEGPGFKPTTSPNSSIQPAPSAELHYIVEVIWMSPSVTLHLLLQYLELPFRLMTRLFPVWSPRTTVSIDSESGKRKLVIRKVKVNYGFLTPSLSWGLTWARLLTLLW